MIDGLKPYPAYKDSGVRWLAEVPANWEVRRLKQIARLAYGDSLAAESRQQGAVPVFGSNGRVGFHSVSNTKAPCIVIGRKGSFGKVNFSVDPVFAIDTTFLVDRRFTSADVRWLFYLLGYLRLDEVSRDSAVPGLDREEAYQRLAPLPPLPEQAAIVRFLDHADRLIRRYIRAKQKLIKLLEEQKQAIIHRAVTRGLDPTNSPGANLNAGQQAGGPKGEGRESPSSVRLKSSGVEWLGDVPEHWETRRLKTLVTESVAGPYGSSLTKAMYTSAGYRVYGQQQVIPDDFSVGDYYISEQRYEEMSRYRVFPGDILVSVMGTVGRVAVVPESVEPGIINPRLVRYRPNLEKVSPRYLQMAMLSPTAQAQFTEGAKGTTMEGLNMQILGRLLLAIPPLVEQDAILAAVGADAEQLDKAIKAASQGISLLREYRTRLIADVVTGKLDVREAAAQLPDEAKKLEPLDEADALTDAEEEGVEDLDAVREEAEA